MARKVATWPNGTRPILKSVSDKDLKAFRKGELRV
jgi:hypothetical protein